MIDEIKSKTSLTQEFLSLYENNEGVLHVEYGKHMKNNILVFFDSKLLNSKLPFKWGKFSVVLYDVRLIRDSAHNFYTSLKKETDSEEMAEIYKDAIILCEDLLNGYRKKEQALLLS